MKITSPAFGHNQSIPSKYTCDGENVNPPLSFHDVPQETKSLVLLMEDPDVPHNLRADGMWDHWVVYNIDPTVTAIEEGKTPEGSVGLNTSGGAAYQGACPPNGQHRYFFKLYALDTVLDFDDASKVTKVLVENALEGHVLAKAELIGVYSRN